MSQKLLYIPYQLIRPYYEKTCWHRCVIEELNDKKLQVAYSFCRFVTRKYAKTFYFATRFLPHKKQRSIFAIYALCRYLDNLVDEGEDIINKTSISEYDAGLLLQASKEDLIRVYEGITVDNPILTSFSNVLRFHDIPINLPLDLIDGVNMDLNKNQYETFDELYDYCFKVASTVGLMTAEVFGYHSKDALKHAVDLGIAMQLTNILRDIGEDLKHGRVYIPQEELRSYGVSVRNLMEGIVDESFKSLMRFQIQRARRYYQSAEKGITMLSPDSRLPVYLAHHNYSAILSKIEMHDYRVFDRRVYLTMPEKMLVLPKLWWKL